VANCNIKKSEQFTEDNLTVKRPGTGISADRYYRFLGKEATRNYLKDELIDE
jgi:sialic acid synthase SpsE